MDGHFGALEEAELMSIFKPQFDLSKIAGGITKASPGFDLTAIKKKGSPLVAKPVFTEELFHVAEKIKADKIARGELDARGNAIGTRYYDDGTPIRPRKQNSPIPGNGTAKRRKHITIKVGNIFGDLIVRRKGPRIKAARPNLQERWRCECSCGKQIIVPRYYLLRTPNPKTHCGCKVQTIKSQNPREYRIYMMVHQRCFNEKHVSYQHYLKNGITLYEPWNNSHKDGFKKFFAEVGKSPSQWHSLDRIHNRRGYEPGNLRWATAEEQRANQGDRIAGLTSDEIADLGLTEEEYIEKILRGEVQ